MRMHSFVPLHRLGALAVALGLSLVAGRALADGAAVPPEPARAKAGYPQLPWQRPAAADAPKLSAELTDLLAHAPAEVRKWVAPVAREVSVVTPFEGTFHLWEVFDGGGHRVGFFSGEGRRAQEWTYYRDDDEIKLTDEDGDGVPDRRARSFMKGEVLLKVVVEVRNGRGWRIESIEDLSTCGTRGKKTTRFLPSGKKQVTYASCVIS